MGCGGSGGDAKPPGSSGSDLTRQTSPSDFKQTLAIVRHSERKDQVEPAFLETDEHKEWPFDTPLTEPGIKLAHDVGIELAKEHQRAKFSMIVCSPYRRCLQTAAQIAKEVKLPVLIDQEIQEVWDKDMPGDKPPHRHAAQLVAMAKELGITVKNPALDDGSGGVKLFGKVPANYPEVTKDGHQRSLVRIEYYVQESEKNKQNYIIVGHAPCIAAMAQIFEHDQIIIEKLEYCATVIARRGVTKTVQEQEKQHAKSVFASQWEVECRRIKMGLNMEADEDNHQKYCEETLERVRERRKKDTVSDKMLSGILSSGLKDTLKEIDEDEKDRV